ncbi:hypothetical protein FRC17_004360, partial [Serendipita sp. 399]
VFQNLEPFLEAICSHELGQKVLPKIKKELKSYRKTLSKSLEVAEHGFSLAQDNASLFAALRNPKRYSDEEIKDFIADASERATTAEKDVKEVVDLVRANRQGIVQARDELKTVNEKVQEQETNMTNEKVTAQNRAQFWGSVAKIVSGVSKLIVSLPVQDTEEGNELLIILPFLLPMIEWGATELKASHTQKAEERAASAKRCTAALEQLDTAIVNLNDLETHLDHIVSWWLSVHSHLTNAGKRLETMRRPSKIRLEQLQGDFEVIRDSFLAYKSGVTRLLDYYSPATADITEEC